MPYAGRARHYVYGFVALLLAGGASAALASPERCPAPRPGDARAWLNRSLSPHCRASAVLASFKSMDEKLDALTGGKLGPRSTKWLTDRGLPAIRGGDGPAGIRGGGVSVTSFPTPLAMAASFDPATAELYGRTLGSEFFDYGLNQMGGPALDVTRTWHFGRSTESLGEDPFLIAAMAGPEVRGIQSNHVRSMTKHFAVYNQEQGRAGDHPLRTKPGVNAILSERTIREIYLPGFKAAVTVGGAGQIMCAFPRVNGVYACEHPLLLGILKHEWGFDGQVVPDFPDGQRSIIAAINAGLDSGIFISAPPPKDSASSLATATDNSFDGEDIRAAVKAGTISAARIDDMLMRRLVPDFRIGTFDHPASRVAEDVSTPARRAIATDLITRGAVLLKNERGILPFGPDVHSIAIIGEQAGPHAVLAEVGSGNVMPYHLTPILPAVRERAGAGVAVSYARGTLGLDRLPLIPAGMVRSAEGAGGFKAEYFANPDLDFSGKPFLTRQEAAVNNTAIPRAAEFPANRAWSARWTGRFTPVEDGIQNFTLAGSGTARLFIDGKPMGEYANADFGDTVYANVPMKAGQPVEIRVEWTPRVTFRQEAVDDYGTTLGPAVRLGWAGPNSLIAEAVAAARKADVAVVVVGNRAGEGMDRLSLALPNDQDALIEAVAAANPRTVVLLTTSGAVTMPWLDHVPAVMEMWLAGDSTGPAAARLLFGDAEPAGRLPVTFPRNEQQGPGQTVAEYPGTRTPDGGHEERFAEELEVGYRYWDAKGQDPLFPFGYGLSYSSFEIGDAKVRKAASGGATVDVAVRNVGKRAGSEVVQVYVGFPATAGEPPKQLKGFRKVSLRPGETRRVRVTLDPSAFQYWHPDSRRWAADAGLYKVMVGRSSRDISYTTDLRITPR